MIPGKRYTPEDILRLTLRRKWFLILPLLVALAGTVPILRMMPNRYRSETLILVVPQRVPESYVRSTVTSRIEDRLQTISQQILSRTRLERIINDFDLYQAERRTEVMEDVVGRMRRDIGTVDIVRGDAFRVGYTSSDALVAQKVTERLASLFIEENLRDRTVLAEATNQFLESQLQEARTRLVEHEKKLETYRRQHVGELPSQGQANMQAVTTLQSQVQGLSDSVARDRDRLFVIERALADLPAQREAGLIAGTTSAPQADADGLPVGSAIDRLAAARQMLRTLETRLKPEHPDIVRMNRLIREIEVKAAEERAAATAKVPLPGRPSEAAVREAQLQEERATLNRQIAQKEAQLNTLHASIASYQAKLEAIPARESEMTELMRDYDTMTKVYVDLLGKRESSKVAANLESRQIGEQFKVLDPASRPERPFSPNRPRIVGMGAMGGLAFGLAVIVLLELRDSTFRSDRDVIQALKLPVLAMIPRMSNAIERQRHRRRLMMGGGVAAAVLLVAAGVFLRFLN